MEGFKDSSNNFDSENKEWVLLFFSSYQRRE